MGQKQHVYFELRAFKTLLWLLLPFVPFSGILTENGGGGSLIALRLLLGFWCYINKTIEFD